MATMADPHIYSPMSLAMHLAKMEDADEPRPFEWARLIDDAIEEATYGHFDDDRYAAAAAIVGALGDWSEGWRGKREVPRRQEVYRNLFLPIVPRLYQLVLQLEEAEYATHSMSSAGKVKKKQARELSRQAHAVADGIDRWLDAL